MQAYFDNSATTKPLPEVVDAVTRAMTETWGNPSSLHRIGDAADAELGNGMPEFTIDDIRQEEI